MGKIEHAIHEIHDIHTSASRDQWMNQLHPLVKLVVTVLYIAVVVSFDKYDIAGLAGMVVYPIAGFVLAELSVWDCVKRLRIVLPLVCFIGILNPVFDRVPLEIGGLSLNAGFLSMVTLILKGVFTVFASYILIASTTVEKLCYALRLLHVPKILVTELLLIYRYITVLLGEVNRVTQSYALRAPGQKGIHWKAWGTLAGQILLRSMDRANMVYESMVLRGYGGEFGYLGGSVRMRAKDIAYLAVWTGIMIGLRKVPVIMVIGSLLRNLGGWMP